MKVGLEQYPQIEEGDLVNLMGMFKIFIPDIITYQDPQQTGRMNEHSGE